MRAPESAPAFSVVCTVVVVVTTVVVTTTVSTVGAVTPVTVAWYALAPYSLAIA